ncbi:MAG: membrane dipeptidase [Patescibacteria group bacterium]
MQPIYADTLGFIGGKMGPPEFTPEIFARLRESGVRLVQWAGPHPAHQKWENLIHEVRETEGRLESLPHQFRIVRNGRDLRVIEHTDIVYVVMGIQNPCLIEDRWDRLDELKEAGVRVMQVAYWDERDAIYGCGYLTENDTGLTALGHEYLRELAKRGFILDLSHTGERTALEALEAYSGRVMISHTGSRQAYNHPRNATNDIIRRVAERDGIIGIYTMTFFLDAENNGIESWLRHVDYVAHTANWRWANTITVGSDAPVTGFTNIEEAEADFPRLTASLERGRPINPRWAPRWPAFTPEFNGTDRFRVMERALAAWCGLEVASRICGTNARNFYLYSIKP